MSSELVTLESHAATLNRLAMDYERLLPDVQLAIEQHGQLCGEGCRVCEGLGLIAENTATLAREIKMAALRAIEHAIDAREGAE